MAKVLVLGEDSRSFLSVIRSLGRKGVEVHIAWCPHYKPAAKSRFVYKWHALPRFPDLEWKQALVSLLSSEKFDLVMPCNDESIIPIMSNRQELEKYAKVTLVNDKAYQYVSNKDKANELAREIGLRLPREIITNKLTINIEKTIDDFGFPIVIKPLASFTNEVSERKEVKKAYNLNELSLVLAGYEDDEAFSVQENFTGVGVGVEVLAREGKILYAFQHERVHEPIRGGASSYRKSVPLNQELLDGATKFISALDYTGVGMIEFKYNKKTKDWCFIEINGRFWGSLPLHVASGADFPYYLYQMYMENKTDFDHKYKIDVYSRNIINDVRWQVANFKADKNDPTLLTKRLHEVLFEIKNVLMLKEHIDSFSIDDPFPLLQECSTLLKMGMASLRFKIPYANKKKIHQQFEQAKSISFVCLGNVNRSPFAEILGKQLFSDKVITSAGHGAQIDRHSPSNARAIAQEYGVDMSSHLSKPLSQEIVDNVDLIFIFDAINYFQVLLQFPEAKTKIASLGSLAGLKKISDPDKQPKEFYRVVFNEISSSLRSLL